MARMISAALLLGLVVATSSLRAEEPACQRCEVGVPMLSKIPYVNRLFKNVGVSRDCETCTTGGCPGQVKAEELPCPAGVVGVQIPGAGQCFRIIGDDGFERIGVDFDFNVQAADATCTAGTCPGGTCTAAACTACPTKQVSAELIAEVETQSAILEAYAGFSAELDALRDKYEDQKSELIEAVLEARIENAALAAKLEFAAEREKLAVENAVLKAQLATVTAPANDATQLSQENAALKAKLAKLEARLANLASPVEKSADKTPVKRKR